MFVGRWGLPTHLPSHTPTHPLAAVCHHRSYDDLSSASDNIDLQTTILSRFDLIFIVRDVPDEARDSEIARCVCVQGGVRGACAQELGCLGGVCSVQQQGRWCVQIWRDFFGQPVLQLCAHMCWPGPLLPSPSALAQLPRPAAALCLSIPPPRRFQARACSAQQRKPPAGTVARWCCCRGYSGG